MASALTVQDLWKSYAAGVQGCSARVWVLRGCSFEIADGERVALVGTAASGKSTLLRCIAGWLRADRGQVVASPTLLLVDERPVPHGSGAAMLLTARREADVRGMVDRVILLREGRLHHAEPVSRMLVAEPGRRTLR